jgi:glycosyltransferase involved in cell wall biosynthesis/predicted flap endonuclease-1-like 5' DNA nuclease
MITVVVPCYNDGDIVGTAIHSVLRQRGDVEFEVVLVDDGSDSPVENLSGDNRVRVIRHDRNYGLSAALNTGIEAGRGDRFTILASDDELAPDYMAHMASVDADIVSCDMLVGGMTVRAKAGTLDNLILNNCHSYAALVKRWVYDATGGFKLTMNPSWEDWEFWLNAAKQGARWEHINRPLHIYHRRAGGRDEQAQTQEVLLWGKLMGYHQDLYGPGRGWVTVVIPCYNHERYVADAVRSALDQVYPHVRVVVVDDKSPGDVDAALEDVKCDRVTLLRQPVNRHLSAARNTGIMYSIHEHQPEYLVMLDADDELHPEYIECAMGEVTRTHEYIYTDLTLIGDAYHVLEMPNWDCVMLTKKHLHPCTFLMYTQMWQDIAIQRGYGYDESMRKGWEDWEFVLAALEAGYCGRRLSGGYFRYRIHAGGSMRTAAGKEKSELSAYLRHTHPWVRQKEVARAMCKTCGGRGRYTRILPTATGGISVITIPGVGDFNPDDVLAVRYGGSTTSVMTKQGAQGQVYKYSSDSEKQKFGYGPILTIFARDAHLFVGTFEIKRIDAGLASQLGTVNTGGPSVPSSAQSTEASGPPPPLPPTAEPPPERAAVEVVRYEERRPQPVMPPRGSVEAPLGGTTIPDDLTVNEAIELTQQKAPPGTAARGQELEPEDFTQIKGIGPKGHKALVASGYAVLDDLVTAAPGELALVLKVSEARAEVIQEAAQQFIEENPLVDDE